MEVHNINEIHPMVFPTGRKTRVMIGSNGLVKGSNFCQGFVEIEPGGSIPEHNHETVESYTILKGEGVITLNGEEKEMGSGDYIFIPPYVKHSLVNTGEEVMNMLFVYSPQIVVDHWEKELCRGKDK